MKKIFAFEDNVDNKGNPSEIKITRFQKRIPIETRVLKFDGKVIHFTDWGHCETISTVTESTVDLFNCIDENEEKKDDAWVLSDNRAHSVQVKDQYKSEVKK